MPNVKSMGVLCDFLSYPHTNVLRTAIWKTRQSAKSFPWFHISPLVITVSHYTAQPNFRQDWWVLSPITFHGASTHSNMLSVPILPVQPFLQRWPMDFRKKIQWKFFNPGKTKTYISFQKKKKTDHSFSTENCSLLSLNSASLCRLVIICHLLSLDNRMHWFIALKLSC